MKKLLIVTAVFEGITGLNLIAAPTLFIGMLLGVTLEDPVPLMICRLTGSALISLAIICWECRTHAEAGRGIAKALLFYNFAALSILLYAAVGGGFSGLALWPAVVAHVGLGGWCMKSLAKN
jgi:hypothetical protein